MRVSCLLPFVLAGMLPAQSFIVDANNGPGAQFTSIAAAVAAVPNGATLLVRPGAYQPFAINSPALTILGDSGVDILGSVTVSNTAPSQQVTLAGLDFQATTPGVGAMLQLLDCNGPVLLDRVTTPVNMPMQPLISVFWSFVVGLNVQRCSQVVIRSCTITTANLSDSYAVVESSLLRGSAAGLSPNNILVSATFGLTVGGGRCDVAGTSQLLGGDGFPGAGDSPGLRAILTVVNVRAGVIASGAGVGATPVWALMIASATVRVDPGVVITASSPLPWLTPPLVVTMPSVHSLGAAPGGTMSATVATAAGDLVALFVGLLGPRIVIPGLPEPWWLNPAWTWSHAVGVHQASAPIGATTAVPNIAALRGVAVTWQAVTLGPNGVAVSNASLALVR